MARSRSRVRYPEFSRLPGDERKARLREKMNAETPPTSNKRARRDYLMALEASEAIQAGELSPREIDPYDRVLGLA